MISAILFLFRTHTVIVCIHSSFMPYFYVWKTFFSLFMHKARIRVEDIDEIAGTTLIILLPEKSHCSYFVNTSALKQSSEICIHIEQRNHSPLQLPLAPGV